MRVLRPVAIFLCFVLMMTLLHIIGTTSAHAQTSTPTPTRTPTPTTAPTATPTFTPTPGFPGTWPTPLPTPTSVVPGNSNAVWGCRYIPGVPAECTWGTEFSSNAVFEDASTSGATSRTQYLLIVAPLTAKLVEVECTTLVVALKGSAQTSTSVIGEVTSLLLGGSDEEFVDFVGQDGYLEHTRHALYTLANPAGAWVDWSYVPQGSSSIDTTDYPQVKVNAVMLSSGSLPSKFTSGYACQVLNIQYKDNSEQPPANNPQWATPTPTVEATPTTCYIGCGMETPLPWETPVGWVSTPSPIEFGTTPGGTSCYVLIPEFSWGPYTVFGNELEFDIDEFELCATENTISWVIFDIDLGVWVTGLAFIIAIAMLYSRFK